jgi:hypothetical protein
LSFLRKQESSYFNGFWIPAFAGVTDFGLFTKPSRIELSKTTKRSLDYTAQRSRNQKEPMKSPPHPPFSPERLCRNHEGGLIPAESRRGGIRLLSFRMRSFKGMGNQPS